MTTLFNNFHSREFKQLGTKTIYQLVTAKMLDLSESNLDQITAICNEPEIFNWLFSERCPDGVYKKSDAKSFLTWAHQGWEKGEYFVFFMLTPTGEIAGCIDIKENNLDKSEMGYWVSQYHKGLGTPATEVLCEVAKNAGFKKLFAGLKPENKRSEKVLIRNNFELDQNEINDPQYAKAYSILLG